LTLTNNQHLLSTTVGSDRPGIEMYVIGRQIGFHIGRYPPYAAISLPSGNEYYPNTNDWVHVLLTYDNSVSADQLKIYVNSCFSGSASQLNPCQNQNQYSTMKFGRNQESANYLYNGQMDELRFYNRVLNDDEIMELFNEGGINPCPTPGMIVYYPFNGNTNDESGNENHLTNNGALPTCDRIGIYNAALFFDGSNDFCIAPNSTSLNPSENLTMIAWVFPQSTNGSQYIVRKSTVLPYKGYFMRILNGSLSIWFGSAPQDIITNVIIPENSWSQIAVTFNSGNYKVFLNSQLQESGSASYDLICDSDLYISKHFTSAGYFNGRIDDVRLYNRTLIESEIQELYSEEVLQPIVVNLGDDITVCETEPIVLDAGNPGYSYLWTTGETTQTISVTSSGNYSVEVSNACLTASDTVNVTFNPLPVVDAGDTATIYIGYTPIETQLIATGGVEYLWSPVEGLSDPTIADPIAQPGTSTSYTINGTDDNGCVNSDSVFVIVIDAVCGNNQNKVLMCHVLPNGNTKTVCVSPNAVPVLVAQGSYVGPCYKVAEVIDDEIIDVEYTEDLTVSAYPNPFVSSCMIDVTLARSTKVTLQIFDIHGRLVDNIFAGKLELGNHSFEWGDSDAEKKSSIYFIRVISEYGTKNVKLLYK